MSAGKRLKEVRSNSGLTQTQFGEIFGLKQTQIKDIETDKQKVSVELAEKIAINFSIDPWWLLTGKGKMLENEIKSTNNAIECININLYDDIYASAGYGAYNSDTVPVKMQFDKNFLSQILGITRFDNLDIIKVTGDSMLPAIKDGEYIVVERSSSAKNGDTIIARIEDEIYVKRYQKIPFEKWIKLESENNIYPSIELNTQDKLDALTIVGVVRSKIKLY